MNIIVAFILLASYTASICIVNRHIPSSLSASVFCLSKSGSWLWTVTTGAVAFLIVPSFIDAASERMKIIAFAACVGLAFVACTPLVKDKNDLAYKVHMAGAWTCAICSQVVIAVDRPIILLCWMPWIIVAFVKMKEWRMATFWAEISCFVSTILYLCYMNSLLF